MTMGNASSLYQGINKRLKCVVKVSNVTNQNLSAVCQPRANQDGCALRTVHHSCTYKRKYWFLTVDPWLLWGKTQHKMWLKSGVRKQQSAYSRPAEVHIFLLAFQANNPLAWRNYYYPANFSPKLWTFSLHTWSHIWGAKLKQWRCRTADNTGLILFSGDEKVSHIQTNHHHRSGKEQGEHTHQKEIGHIIFLIFF